MSGERKEVKKVSFQDRAVIESLLGMKPEDLVNTISDVLQRRARIADEVGRDREEK